MKMAQTVTIYKNKLIIMAGHSDITKKLTNGIGNSQSLHIGDIAQFVSHLTVPRNLMGSEWAVGVNETLTKTLPYHEYYTVDEPQTHLKDVPSLRNLVIKTPDGTILKAGTDYNVVKAALKPVAILSISRIK